MEGEITAPEGYVFWSIVIPIALFTALNWWATRKNK